MKKSSMGACMKEWKKAHPHGRSKKAMSKKDAHKQAVAACMNAVNESIKSLIEGMTFSKFLMLEMSEDLDTGSVRGFIRSLPQYQEMMKDQRSKPEALKLAKSLVDEFGDGPIDPRAQDYILDTMDELNSKFFRGTNLGDWKGEKEYQDQQKMQQDLDTAADKWERTMGMDAETGAELPVKKERMKRGATHQAGKFAKARAEMSAMGSEEGDNLAAAKSRAASVGAPRTGTKSSAARAIFGEMYGNARPSEIINRMMSEVGMSKPHATTYYYKFKKAAG